MLATPPAAAASSTSESKTFVSLMNSVFGLESGSFREERLARLIKAQLEEDELASSVRFVQKGVEL